MEGELEKYLAGAEPAEKAEWRGRMYELCEIQYFIESDQCTSLESLRKYTVKRADLISKGLRVSQRPSDDTVPLDHATMLARGEALVKKWSEETTIEDWK